MKRSKNRNLYLARKFAPYFKPHMAVMLFDLFCASMTTLCELVLPMIVREITQRATTDISTLTVRLILTMCGVYVLLRVIDTAANYYMQSVGHNMGAQIETDMRRDMFSHLQMLQNSYYDNTKIGQLMSRITTDLNDVTEFAHHFPEEIFIAIIKITVSFVILARMNLLLTLIVFVMLPLMVIFSRHFSQKMRQSFKDSRHQLGELNAQVEDTLGGIRVVKSFANENVEEKKFASGNQRFLNIKHRMYANMAGFHSVTRFFDGIMYIAVVMVGALFLISDNPVMKLTASDLVAFLLYVTTLLASIRRIVEFSESFQRGMTGLERFVEVMDEPVTIVDAPDAIELTNVKGEVTFDDVTFTYAENLDNVLAPHQPYGEARRIRGAGRPLRRRKDHDVQPDSALLRGDGRQREDRRRGRAQAQAAFAAQPDRHGAAGCVSVLRLGVRQHRIRQARRDARGDHRGGEAGRRA